MNFKLDTSDYLGFAYDNYLNELQALAISQPKVYYQMRKDVLSLLKDKVVKDVYTAYYSLLTTGVVAGMRVIEEKLHCQPSYPKQDASKFALEAAKTVNHILDKCMEIILPANHLDVAELRIKKKHLADNIEA